MAERCHIALMSNHVVFFAAFVIFLLCRHQGTLWNQPGKRSSGPPEHTILIWFEISEIAFELSL